MTFQWACLTWVSRSNESARCWFSTWFTFVRSAAGMSRRVAQTIDLIEGLVLDGSLGEGRIDESYARIQAFKAGLPA